MQGRGKGNRQEISVGESTWNPEPCSTGANILSKRHLAPHEIGWHMYIDAHPSRTTSCALAKEERVRRDESGEPGNHATSHQVKQHERHGYTTRFHDNTLIPQHTQLERPISAPSLFIIGRWIGSERCVYLSLCRFVEDWCGRGPREVHGEEQQQKQ